MKTVLTTLLSGMRHVTRVEVAPVRATGDITKSSSNRPSAQARPAGPPDTLEGTIDHLKGKLVTSPVELLDTHASLSTFYHLNAGLFGSDKSGSVPSRSRTLPLPPSTRVPLTQRVGDTTDGSVSALSTPKASSASLSSPKASSASVSPKRTTRTDQDEVPRQELEKALEELREAQIAATKQGDKVRVASVNRRIDGILRELANMGEQ